MRKTHWISLAISLAIAAVFAILEQRRAHYFLRPPAPPSSAVQDPTAEKETREREDNSGDKKMAYFAAHNFRRVKWLAASSEQT